MRKLMS